MLVLARKCSRCGELYEKGTDNRDANGFIFVHIREKDTLFKDGPYDLCPDCMENLNTWFYDRKGSVYKVDEKEKEPTLKDIVSVYQPECVDYIYEAGVYGCPNDYDYLNISEKLCQSSSSHPSRKNCYECWNRPFKKKEANT